MTKTWMFALTGAMLLCAGELRAETTLPSIVGNHMVLQRDRENPLWGWDERGTKVVVNITNVEARETATVTTTAGDDGKWSVTLPALPAGGPYTITIKGSSGVQLTDVLFGEVWLCSGQSNMEWPVAASTNKDEEIAAATHPRIRHIKIPHTPQDVPQANVPSEGWTVCSPGTVPGYTAVGYFFGRHLQQELDVPIGLIGSNWGGTRIEPWTPPVGFEASDNPQIQELGTRKYPLKNDKGEINHQTAQALYNGMIAPLVPYGIRGAIWYQGESNNGEGMLYSEKMKALIAGWRSLWSNPDMPFYYVQLAPFRYGGAPTNLPGIWEAQAKTLAVPHTGMAVTVDIATVDNIHPPNKQDVGKRLALWALADAYGKKDIVYSGPLYKSMTVDGNKVRLSFDHVGGGLVARDGKPLSHFQVAGEDKNFVDAKAEIDGETIVVSAAGVAAPVAVRFGWHQEAEPNLSNKEGLPASPFRTDDWK